MPHTNHHRVLIIGNRRDVRNELVTLLSGYGYFVDYCGSRLEGLKRFRAHKQAIVILDVPILKKFPRRMIQFFQKVQKNTIVLISAHKDEEMEAFDCLRYGAYDILNLPLKTEFLKLTLSRAQSHHKLILENVFVKNTVFFGVLMAPIWGLLGYLLFKA